MKLPLLALALSFAPRISEAAPVYAVPAIGTCVQASYGWDQVYWWYEILANYNPQAATVYCPLQVGAATVEITDIAFVYVWVIDESPTENVQAALCFVDQANGSSSCGEYEFSSGSAGARELLVVHPPRGWNGIVGTAYLKITIPGETGEYIDSGVTGFQVHSTL